MSVSKMYDDERKEMLAIISDMLKNDLVSGSSGNVSMRIDDHVLITPSSVRYIAMESEDLMVLDMDTKIIEGERNPSVEYPMHIEIYKQRKDALAVIHSHGIYSTALALVNKSLPPMLDEVVPKLGGEIRVSPYAPTGTKELGKKVVEAMNLRSAVLLANHGALCVGRTLKEALEAALLLERVCRIYIHALQIGEPSQLPEDVVEDEADIWQMEKGY